MAANIKGITIEINGNVTPLQKELSKVNKSLKDTQRQLKDVDKSGRWEKQKIFEISVGAFLRPRTQSDTNFFLFLLSRSQSHDRN